MQLQLRLVEHTLKVKAGHCILCLTLVLKICNMYVVWWGRYVLLCSPLTYLPFISCSHSLHIFNYRNYTRDPNCYYIQTFCFQLVVFYRLGSFSSGTFSFLQKTTDTYRKRLVTSIIWKWPQWLNHLILIPEFYPQDFRPLDLCSESSSCFPKFFWK